MDFMHNDERNTRICVALFKLSCIKHRPRVELSKEEEADVEHIVTKLLEWCADSRNDPVAPPYAAAKAQLQDLARELMNLPRMRRL
ncbi:g2279 [Coccomyxa viridis]|uniref:G2279 protein n=1 Tax=Coccomyxa viridis TaxID=1274662 RepID=A0ABP1FNR1_9CHLO